MPAHLNVEVKTLLAALDGNPCAVQNIRDELSKHQIHKHCIYCGETFAATTKNQKYCPICRQAKVPEKLKKVNNRTYSLRKKIYERLNRRRNNREYSHGICDASSFSSVAQEFKANHTDEEYLSWLREIDRVTK